MVEDKFNKEAILQQTHQESPTKMQAVRSGSTRRVVSLRRLMMALALWSTKKKKEPLCLSLQTKRESLNWE